MAGRPEHQYSEVIAGKIHALVTFGVSQERISSYIPMSVKTIMKHYGDVFDEARINKHEAVEFSLYYNATVRNNVVAQMFYLKTQMPEKYSEKLNEGDKGDLKADILAELASKLPN